MLDFDLKLHILLMASRCIVLARRAESGDRAAALKCQKGKHEPKPQRRLATSRLPPWRWSKAPRHWEISSPPPTDVRNLHRYRYSGRTVSSRPACR